jgi:hypothetical protein
MSNEEQLLEQAQLLISRLERISVDSIWARRSSGARGALLKWVERLEHPAGQDVLVLSDDERLALENALKAGFQFLERAARERFP